MSRVEIGKNAQAGYPSAIVGIGCAAGGLEAIQEILRSFPSNLGVAIVVAQHIDTGGVEVMSELIAPHTSLAVKILGTSPLKLDRNHIYLVPQRRKFQRCEDDFVALATEDIAEQRSTIDGMFRALADNCAVPLVGIVLSGASTDGTLGLAAIRDAGGMTIAQSPDSAAYEEMPRNAAANADCILKPERIAVEIVQHIQHRRRSDAKWSVDLHHAKIEANLPQICDVLLAATEYEFRHYKKQTLVRRVSRRMSILRIDDADEYLAYLQQEREEAHALFRELLVSATAFFRDRDTFAALAEHVIPKLFQDRPEKEPVRIWVPGCATGQEAYTLAMLMMEERDRRGAKAEVQLYATDIDPRALNVAREGAYQATIASELTQQRLDRFFQKRGNQYCVVKELRDACIFSAHNLISDPPFSQMDLISCRNVLIYLGQPLQLKLIPLFHFALRPNGYLLLGPAENLTSHTEIFRPVDKKHRISQRKPGPARTRELLSERGRVNSSLQRQTVGSPNELDIHRIAQRILLDEFAPRYAVINGEGQVICTSSGLERYFEFPDGPFANSVIKISKSGLRSGLRTALREAKNTLRTVVRDDLTLKADDGVQRIQLTVQPMPEIGEGECLFMLVFQEQGPVASRRGNDDVLPDAEVVIEQLECELDQTRTDLESTVQDLESSNEELESSNEELRSLNEELQSTNEELETSKEEIQTGMEALARARSDLQNLLNGTRIATVFLDATGKINSFTPTVTDVYNIRESDVGRPLSDITHKARQMPPVPNVDDFQNDVEYFEDEIQTSDSRWFLRRVLLYRYAHRPDGVILTFVDISDKKREEIRLSAAYGVTQLLADAESFDIVVPELLQRLRETLEADICALWLVDTSSRELYCSSVDVPQSSRHLKAFAERSRDFRFRAGEGLPGHVWKTCKPYVMKDVASDSHKSNLEFLRHHLAETAGLMSGTALPILTGKRCCGVIEIFTSRPLEYEKSLITMLRDVGHEIGQFIRRKQLDDKFRNEEARKSAILEAALDCIITMDMTGNIVDFNSASERTFGYSKADVAGKPLADALIPKELRATHRAGLERYLRTGESNVIGERVELIAERSDGSQFPVELAINVSHNRDGSPLFTGYMRDISERREREAKIIEAQQLAVAANRAKSEFVANMSHEIRTPMTAVLGYADLLLAQEDDPEKLKHLRTIQRNGNFLLEIINDILDLSKIEAGKLDIACERFVLNELAEDIHSMMLVRAVERGLTFSVRFEGRVPEHIVSDPNRLRQILINLVGNAIKFTESGSVTLTVSEISAGDKVLIQFDVTDTGIGISEEQQARLFQAFSQGDASVTRAFGGTGLGLAISHRLARMLGGEIAVESETGKGSRFSFTVDAGDVSSERRTRPTLEQSANRIQTGDASCAQQLSRHVLVVDDRADVRFLTTHMLRNAGATVEEAVDGLDAIQKIEANSERFDLVLLDMQMPRLDGYQTARRLRELGFHKPIVAVTANAMQRDVSRCIEAGCNDFLSKPFGRENLLSVIARVTSQGN